MQSQALPFETCEDVIEWHPRRDGQSGQRPRAQTARRAPRRTASYRASCAGLLYLRATLHCVSPAARRLRTSFWWCGGEGRLAAEFDAPGLGVGPPAPDALREAMEQFVAWMTWLWIIDAVAAAMGRREVQSQPAALR